LVTPAEIALSGSLKLKALAESQDTQFQPVIVPSAPAVIEMVNAELNSNSMSTANEPNLTNPEGVQEVINGLKFSKAPGPNRVPNRALKNLPQRAVLLLVQVFNAILLTINFPRSIDLYTETGKGAGTPLILSAH
jgi:hypothetical protein